MSGDGSGGLVVGRNAPRRRLVAADGERTRDRLDPVAAAEARDKGVCESGTFEIKGDRVIDDFGAASGLKTSPQRRRSRRARRASTPVAGRAPRAAAQSVPASETAALPRVVPDGILGSRNTSRCSLFVRKQLILVAAALSNSSRASRRSAHRSAQRHGEPRKGGGHDAANKCGRAMICSWATRR